MKRSNFLPVLFAGLFFSSSVIACIDPMAAYSSGVLFNKDEGFNLCYFDSLGTEGVHFFRDCKVNDSDLTAKESPSTGMICSRYRMCLSPIICSR